MAPRTGTLIASTLGITVVQLNGSVVTVALTSLRAAFHVDVASLQWVVNAYALLLAALLLSAGLLGDRYGARRIFAAGFAVSAIAALGATLAASYPVLIAMRGLQGVGAALLLPASLSLLDQISPDAKSRSRAIGIWSAAGSLALALGPIAGGVLIARGGWPMVFLPSLPLCLAGLWFTLRDAPHVPGAARAHLDWPGQLIAIVALASLTWGAKSAAQGWLPLPILACAGLFAVASAAFFLIEWRSSAPMVPPSLFRNAPFAAVVGARALVNLTYYGLVFVFSLFFQTVQHRSALATGLMFLPMTSGLIVMTIVTGRLCARFGPRRPALAGLFIASGGYLGLALVSTSTPIALFAVPFLVVGAGIALVVPSLTIACLGAVPAGETGIASGVLNASAQMGAVIGVAVFAAMISNDRPAAFVAGTQAAVLTAIGALGVGFALLARFMKQPSDTLRGESHVSG